MRGLKQAHLYTVATLRAKLSVGVVSIDMRRYILALVLVAVARAMPALENEVNDPGLVGSVIGVVKECSEGDISLCLKVCEVTSDIQ